MSAPIRIAVALAGLVVVLLGCASPGVGGPYPYPEKAPSGSYQSGGSDDDEEEERIRRDRYRREEEDDEEEERRSFDEDDQMEQDIEHTNVEDGNDDGL